MGQQRSSPPPRSRHQWVRRSLVGDGGVCCVCHESLHATFAAPHAQKCLFCQRTVHDDCLPTMPEEEEACDFGEFAEFILPPSALVRRSRSEDRNGRHGDPREWAVDVSLLASSGAGGRPVAAFVNPCSGGKLGAMVASQLRCLLNPAQVFPSDAAGLVAGLTLFRSVPRFWVLVCGGDGTIGSALTTMVSLQLSHVPVGILPIGTGNDLARCFNWGGGYHGEDVSGILKDFQNAYESSLDRWSVVTKPISPVTTNALNNHHVDTMNSYFGIGVDAAVVLQFDLLRKQRPGWFRNQFMNKIIYAAVGGNEQILKTCSGFPDHVAVFCDGEKMDLPSYLEGIIVLNINCYAGGVDMWGTDRGDFEVEEETEHLVHRKANWRPWSRHDRLLEVVGVISSIHVGQVKIGVSNTIRLRQCSTLEFVTDAAMPAHIDGEPWMQPPCRLTISLKNQAAMLTRSSSEIDRLKARMGAVLSEATTRGTITEEQRRQLAREMSRL